MADSKITSLTADTAPDGADLVVTVDNVAGTPVNKKVTLANLGKAIDAGTIPNTPAGNIAATDVQAAIDELDSEKIGAATTDTLTNKTFDANGTGNSLSNVDVADLANGTDGELITWDALGVPATVATGTAAQVLTSNGPGAAPTFQAAGGGGNKTVWLRPLFSDSSLEFISNTDASGAKLTDGVNRKALTNWTMPDDFTSFTSVKIYWSTGAISANMYASFHGRARTADEAFSGGSSDSIAITTYGSSATIEGLNVTDITASVNGLTVSADDILEFRIQRDASNASDTLNDTVFVHGWQIVYS